jgi:hypothetical protein
MTRMPDEMKVESKGDNTYTFDFGVGAETIVANGTDQPGYGGTMLSVKAGARDTWIVERRKDGSSRRPGSSRRTAVRSRTSSAGSRPTGPRSAWTTSTSAAVEDRASRETGRASRRR